VSYPISVVEIPSATAMHLHKTLHVDRISSDVAAGMGDLFGQVAAAGMNPIGPPAITYLGEFRSGGELEAEFSVPIDEQKTDVKSNGAQVKTDPASTVAQTLHRGNYETIEGAYSALTNWIADSPYSAAGPPTEVYLVGPDQVSDPDALVTEIRIPLKP